MVKKLKFFENQEETENTLKIEREIRGIRGYFRVILLQLLDCKLSFNQIVEKIKQAEKHTGSTQRIDRLQEKIYKELKFGLKKEFVIDEDGFYSLTDKGKKITRLLGQTLLFNNTNVVPKNKPISRFAFTTHLFLSLTKLVFGLLSGSAGLITDGIKNNADFMSTALSWLGINRKSEKLASLLIVITMHLALATSAFVIVYRILHVQPIRLALATFIISIGTSFITLGLSVYHYFIGQIKNNYEILGHAINFRNRFITSLVVSAGILMSILGVKYQIPFLLRIDTLVAVLVSTLLLFITIPLTLELVSSESKEKHVIHFTQVMNRLAKKKLIYSWLEKNLASESLSLEELDEKFRKDFFIDTKRIPSVFSTLYQPSKGNELHEQIDRLIRLNHLKLEDGKYSFVKSDK